MRGYARRRDWPPDELGPLSTASMSNPKRQPRPGEHLTLHMSRGVFLLLVVLLATLLLGVDPAELVRLIR